MSDKCGDFIDKYGEAELERIFEACCEYDGKNDTPIEGVYISERVEHNACNHTYYGISTINDEEVCWEMDSGDWAGSYMRYFGEEFKEPPRGFYSRHFDIGHGIRGGELPRRTVMLDLYVGWTLGKHDPNFKKMEQGYAYDAHFAPGGKTNDHYRAYAQSKGLILSGEWIDESVERVDYDKQVQPFYNVAMSIGYSTEGRDRPEYAQAQAAYCQALQRYLNSVGRTEAAALARDNAKEWQEWEKLFRVGETTKSILEGYKAALAQAFGALAHADS